MARSDYRRKQYGFYFGKVYWSTCQYATFRGR